MFLLHFQANRMRRRCGSYIGWCCLRLAFLESTDSDLTILHFRYGVRSNTLILSQVVIYSLQILISSKWMESWQMIRWYDLWRPKRRHALWMMLEVSIIAVQLSSIKRWFLTHSHLHECTVYIYDYIICIHWKSRVHHDTFFLWKYHQHRG